MLKPKQNKWEMDGLLAMACLGENEVRPRRKRRSQYDVERQSIPRIVSDLARFKAKRVGQSNVMPRLEEAAESGNETAFLKALTEISWQGRPATEFVHAIKLALKIGAPTAAQRIYTEAISRYQNHPDIQRYARLFAPPRVQTRTSPSNPTLKANREWLKSHRNEYRGQWVAVRNGELLAAAPSLEDLIGQVGDTPNVLLTRA